MGKLIELTSPAKQLVLINAEQVVSIRPAGSDHPNAHTVILLGSVEQAVLETIEVVRQKVEAELSDK